MCRDWLWVAIPRKVKLTLPWARGHLRSQASLCSQGQSQWASLPPALGSWEKGGWLGARRGGLLGLPSPPASWYPPGSIRRCRPALARGSCSTLLVAV